MMELIVLTFCKMLSLVIVGTTLCLIGPVLIEYDRCVAHRRLRAHWYRATSNHFSL